MRLPSLIFPTRSIPTLEWLLTFFGLFIVYVLYNSYSILWRKIFSIFSLFLPLIMVFFFWFLFFGYFFTETLPIIGHQHCWEFGRTTMLWATEDRLMRKKPEIKDRGNSSAFKKYFFFDLQVTFVALLTVWFLLPCQETVYSMPEVIKEIIMSDVGSCYGGRSWRDWLGRSACSAAHCQTTSRHPQGLR